jgi:hypothetical protein
VVKCGRTWITRNPLLPCVWESSSFSCLWYLSCPSTSSYYHQAMVPILHHIVITNFHPVLVTASYSTDFLLLPKHKMYRNIPPSWSSWNYLSNEPPFAWNRFQTRELCLFYSGDAICPKLISDRASLNVSAISPCTGLQNWWSFMRWKEGLKEILKITFLPLYISEHMLKLNGNNDFPLKPYRWLTILITIGHELMETLRHACKTNQMHILPPGEGRE